MIQEALAALAGGEAITPEQASAVMRELMGGETTPAQTGAFLTALRIRGETPEIVAAMAAVMREKSEHVELEGPLLDTCGTGGDGLGTFNVSTAAAFVAAAAGVRVAKHGNRAASSACGSADLLEALGAQISLSPVAVRECILRAGIGFMFAQRYHPAMKHVAGPRRELGIRTVFNILGPLTNPAGARLHVLGAASPAVAATLARALSILGVDRALVLHSDDGLDEISLAAPVTIHEINGTDVREYRVQALEMGLAPSPAAALRGGSAEENADTLRKLFAGAQGPLLDFVVANAAAAVYVGGAAPGLKEGAELARELIASGKPAEKVEEFVTLTQELGDDA